ncbi:MAG: type II secretion system protein [Pseudomonadales bacterium]|nr:type II secretion system protein [Pseudomonadales bacterium]
MKPERGFSLIELTVVLVLISLATALVAPNLSRAYESLGSRAEIDELLLDVSSLSYLAYSSGRAIRITTREDLNAYTGFALELEIVDPINVTATGVCQGGEVLVVRGGVQQSVLFNPPYCLAELKAYEP